MRTVRGFEVVMLAVPFALLACASDKRPEPSAPSNTATYEGPTPAAPNTTPPVETGEMQPAFGIENRESGPESERPQGAAPEAIKAPTLTDEQIAAVTDAAHGAEIDAAKLAVQKTKDARVRKFAQMLVDDHKKAKQEQSKVVTRLGMNASATSPKLEQFKTSAADTDRTLRSAPANVFDKTFVDLQVADHQMLLDALERDFIPNVQNPELKKSLEDVRPKVSKHLEEALALQKQLTSAPGAVPSNQGMK